MSVDRHRLLNVGGTTGDDYSSPAFVDEQAAAAVASTPSSSSSSLRASSAQVPAATPQASSKPRRAFISNVFPGPPKRPSGNATPMMSTPDPTLSSRESFGTEGSSGASDSTLMHAESSNVSTIGARPSTITSSRDPRSVSTELEDTLGSDEDDEDDLDDDDDDEGEMTAGSSAHRGKGKGRDSSSSTSPKIGTFPVEGETLGPGLTLNRAGKIVKKRNRTLTTPHQAAVLNALLAQTRFPTTEMREEVGRQIGMSARRVQIWFQNRRQSQRKAKDKEVELDQRAYAMPSPQQQQQQQQQAYQQALYAQQSQAAARPLSAGEPHFQYQRPPSAGAPYGVQRSTWHGSESQQPTPHFPPRPESAVMSPTMSVEEPYPGTGYPFTPAHPGVSMYAPQGRQYASSTHSTTSTAPSERMSMYSFRSGSSGHAGPPSSIHSAPAGPGYVPASPIRGGGATFSRPVDQGARPMLRPAMSAAYPQLQQPMPSGLLPGASLPATSQASISTASTSSSMRSYAPSSMSATPTRSIFASEQPKARALTEMLPRFDDFSRLRISSGSKPEREHAPPSRAGKRKPDSNDILDAALATLAPIRGSDIDQRTAQYMARRQIGSDAASLASSSSGSSRGSHGSRSRPTSGVREPAASPSVRSSVASSTKLPPLSSITETVPFPSPPRSSHGYTEPRAGRLGSWSSFDTTGGATSVSSAPQSRSSWSWSVGERDREPSDDGGGHTPPPATRTLHKVPSSVRTNVQHEDDRMLREMFAPSFATQPFPSKKRAQLVFPPPPSSMAARTADDSAMDEDRRGESDVEMDEG